MEAGEAPPEGAEAAECRSALLLALELAEAQRSQIDDLRAQLARSREAEEELRFELEQEREGRRAAQAALCSAAADFARRLAGLQARVLRAERDVVLGGPVLLAAHAVAAAATGGGSGEPQGSRGAGASGAQVWTSASASCSELSKSFLVTARGSPPPGLVPASPQEDASLFTCPRVLHTGTGRKLTPGCGTPRRAQSLSQRLDPLVSQTLESPRR
mmetsp:Transcript_70448/g.194790  ORF Transcript_70448/g.194790 Transcript_70448/m.194790 type:complete len:216 (-) Transcript_70448:16-663(-)